jgi:hypothetical protein
VSAVSAKSPALVPVTARLVILKEALPVLFSVTVCAVLVTSTGWLPKARLVVERLTSGAVPVPERLTVCGLPLALSAMLRVPLCVPLLAGVKPTLIVQTFPTATLVPQLFVWVKSPLTLMLEIVSASLPVSVSVTDWALLELPRG